MVADMGDRVHRFVNGLGPHLADECLTASLQEGKRFDRPIYSGPGQSSRAPSSQYRGDSDQIRPPLPQCTQCGRLHSRQCRLGTDACYACGQTGYMMRDCPSRGGRVRVQDMEAKPPTRQSGPVANKFSDVFPDELSGLPPEQEIDFDIDVLPDTKPISIPPYRIGPAKLRKLKDLLEKGFIRPSSSP
ncbi:uncharacterized protein LOC132042469 [Lycium ferocissimum]|uniref:uncharacterized protein LOC132042469 n=1 Tax=Lycium ferocissimum TaxID=112874 RepID=UPI0028166F36|nr:uncharacterized protein LOC132042469 [Lycium ferocissimum]